MKTSPETSLHDLSGADMSSRLSRHNKFSLSCSWHGAKRVDKSCILFCAVFAVLGEHVSGTTTAVR